VDLLVAQQDQPKAPEGPQRHAEEIEIALFAGHQVGQHDPHRVQHQHGKERVAGHGGDIPQFPLPLHQGGDAPVGDAPQAEGQQDFGDFDKKVQLLDINVCFLDILYTAELKSEHPLASAIIRWLEDSGASTCEAGNFESLTGRGIRLEVEDVTYWVGSQGLLELFGAKIPEKTLAQIADWQENGQSVVYYGKGNELLAALAISDRIKPTSAAAVKELTGMGIEVHLLTGDGVKTAERVADTLGIKYFKAEVMPNDKEEYIMALQKLGKKVAMVGDGINDSQALARADVSIAMGKGTDIAMDVAMITLITSDLLLLPEAIKLSRRTVRLIHQNLFWAFIYNLIGIPLAAGVLFPVNGLLLNPMLASAAMAFSSVSVVLNSLRLKFMK